MEEEEQQKERTKKILLSALDEAYPNTPRRWEGSMKELVQSTVMKGELFFGQIGFKFDSAEFGYEHFEDDDIYGAYRAFVLTGLLQEPHYLAFLDKYKMRYLTDLYRRPVIGYEQPDEEIVTWQYKVGRILSTIYYCNQCDRGFCSDCANETLKSLFKERGDFPDEDLRVPEQERLESDYHSEVEKYFDLGVRFAKERTQNLHKELKHHLRYLMDSYTRIVSRGFQWQDSSDEEAEEEEEEEEEVPSSPTEYEDDEDGLPRKKLKRDLHPTKSEREKSKFLNQRIEETRRLIKEMEELYEVLRNY